MLPIANLANKALFDTDLQQNRNALLHGGYFIDLAAAHPIIHSNTFHFEQAYGWSGVCIEGDSSRWLDLAQRKCKTVGAAVASANASGTYARFYTAGEKS